MFLKQILNLSLFFGLIYSSYALDFTRFYTVRGVPQPLPPLPSEKAKQCLNTLEKELVKCRSQTLRIWNITDYSALGDVCCAQWDAFDCDLDYIEKSKCTKDELEEVGDYFDDLTDFYNEKTCHAFPRTSTHCVIPVLSEAINERPPPPPPLAIDCLANIRLEVRIQCWKIALRKWNITRHKKSPIRNVCCAAWDDIDCLDEVVQLRCLPQEIKVTDQYFKQIEDWAGSGGCNQSTYHSSNCSKVIKIEHHDEEDEQEDEHVDIPANIPEFVDNYKQIIFPAKTQHRQETDPNYQIESDYREFLMNYILTVFPHLMNLLILLSVILVTVIVIQCFMIGRQIRRNQCFSDFGPLAQGYQKVNI